jgi:hypothetical protein
MDLREIAYTLSLFTLFFSSCSKQDEINDKVIQIDIYQPAIEYGRYSETHFYHSAGNE